MKKKFLLLILLAVGGFAYYRYYTTTPKYSLLRAAAAVRAHDAPGFNTYVDVESVAGDLLTQVGESSGLLGKLNSGSLLLKGLSAALKPALAAQAKKQVDAYITTGSVAQAQQAGGSSFSLAGLVGKIVSDSSEFKGVAYETTLPGGMAEVGLEFTQPRYDTTLLVKLRLADLGDHWQVKEITNAGEIIGHIGQMEKRRLLRELTN